MLVNLKQIQIHFFKQIIIPKNYNVFESHCLIPQCLKNHSHLNNTLKYDKNYGEWVGHSLEETANQQGTLLMSTGRLLLLRAKSTGFHASSSLGVYL